MNSFASDANPRGPIAWMARNPVAANLLMLLLMIGGVFQGFQIRQEVFPSIELDEVVIQVPYPGAGPAEVEQGIILAIEEAVGELDGVKEVNATAAEGAATVTVSLHIGTDTRKLTQEIRDAVDRISTFPEDAETPRVSLRTRHRQVVSLMIHGDVDDRVLRQLAEQARDRLLESPMITQVTLSGVRPYEIGIHVPREHLQTYQLTLDEIATRIRKAAVEIPGGAVKTAHGEILVRMDQRKDVGREFAQIPILDGPDGTRLLVGDIATIEDGFADVDRAASFNGQNAVMIEVFRTGDHTPIEVSDETRQIIERLNTTLPEGVAITVRRDRSEYFKDRINLLLRNGALGLCLVLGLLSLFLEIRLAFWVTMGIPVSFLGTLLVLPTFDLSINMISLFAFIIALGIVVDDAIVVGENVFEWRGKNVSQLEAAIHGTREVGIPVVFSVLTNVIAFVPLIFVSGMMGKLFWMIPAVVITAFIMSLIESLLVLPAHLAHSGRAKVVVKKPGLIRRLQMGFSSRFTQSVERIYLPFVRIALSFRYLTLAVGIGLLIIILALIASKRMGMMLFPRVEADYAAVTAVLPYGVSMEKTETVKNRLVAAARDVIQQNGGDQLATGIFTLIGGYGDSQAEGNRADVTVYLTGPEQRPISTHQFVQLWKKQVGTIPGLESISFRSTGGGPSGGPALTVELTHRDVDILQDAAEKLAGALAEFPNVSEIDDGFTQGKRQLNFRLRPEARALGLSALDVARQVRSAFYGSEALRQQRDRNEIKVMVRLPESQRVSEADLDAFLIRTPSGGLIPLMDAVEVIPSTADTVIRRRQGKRVVNVTADVTPRKHTDRIKTALVDTILPQLVTQFPGLSFDFGGRQRHMAESMNDLKNGFPLAMLAMYGILAIPFRSYIQPIIIMTCIPFGIIGAVIGHLLMGYSLSILSMMGMVALSGVVVNDSLVLIDYANRLQRSGLPAKAAICQAAVRRFRPILLTTLTTFGGLAPMIFETSRQARFLIPMAISLGYGVLFATLITLVLVPCLYLIVEDFRPYQ